MALAVFQIGNDSGELRGISGKKSPVGTVEVPTQPFFQTFDVPEGHSRAYDSEYKLLEELASRYGQMPNIEGTVNLYTERPPCASCSSVIDQFRRLFPNIMLRVNYGG
ncbi:MULTISPECIES: deaminase domain-containing protein [unclassified Microcoleus]|uniref:deaminase domain-containing protein n=1 Tax=unclassified Microcoleus TaxID=2642155 RepID=UPI004040BD38